MSSRNNRCPYEKCPSKCPRRNDLNTRYCCQKPCCPCSKCSTQKKPAPTPKKTTSCCGLGGIQAKLITPMTLFLEDGDALLFDLVMPHQNPYIQYQLGSGKFVLGKAGTYMVNWQVSVEGSSETPYVSFALMLDEVMADFATLPLTVGQLACSSLITVERPPAKVSINNYTKDTVYLSRFPPAANLTITHVLEKS